MAKLPARAPRSGKPVRGSHTGRPIMVLLDLLGRRWTLRVLWELRSEPLGFRELQRRCEDVSPSVLSLRLRELVESGIAAPQKSGDYELSPLGRELLTAFAPIQAWADRWARSAK